MQKIAILTGAGISQESGISTFRDQNGLWENHDIMDVASWSGWLKNPQLVLDFYNVRRKQLKSVGPNRAHELCVDLENHFEVKVVTQNVDDLHERAGSSSVLHLHGELRKARSTKDSRLIYPWDEDIHIGDLCKLGFQLRPHIVWFGESVPELEPAIQVVEDCDILIIIGTSLQVYPAASLVNFISPQGLIYYIDPNPHISAEFNQIRKFDLIPERATTGMQKVFDLLIRR